MLQVQHRFPRMRFIALGGATEASIWSNFHEFTPASDRNLPLVLYGVPLPNQSMYVLDRRLRLCPAHVLGEIYIGGKGVAKEYFNDTDKTARALLGEI